MFMHRLLCVLLAVTLGASCAAEPARPAGQQPQPEPAQQNLFDPDLHMRTADVRAGMTGYGLSVFKGTAIERFEVEVLSVLRNTEQIGTDVILIKCSGANLEHTGPIAGMSGSPIYIRCDDGRERLLGAFAFGWPAVKDPIAGVQPIEGMLALDSSPQPDGAGERARAGAGPPSASQWDLLSSRAAAKLMKEQPRSLADLMELAGAPAVRSRASLPGGLQPLSLAMGAGGFGMDASRQLSAALAPAGLGPLLPLDAAGASGPRGRSDADRIEPGSTLIVPVLLGDLNLVATGTCTTVIGDRVFAFGHPLIGEGASNLPMAAGEVNAVIPTQSISFKLGSPGKVLGTLATDAAPGVAGRIGPIPQMIPVSIRVKRGQSQQTFGFEAARHPMLTLAALAAAAQSATDLGGAPDPQGATRWDMTLRYSGGRTLRLRDVGPNDDPFGLGVVGALAMPLMAIEQNPFGSVSLEAVEAEIELVPGPAVQLATLEEVTLPRQRYRPGETVKVNLMLQVFRGGRVQRTVELALPEDLPPGQYPLIVSSSIGAIMGAAQSRPFDFDMKSLDDLFTVLNSMQEYANNAVYVRIDRPEQVRVAVGREALPDLPGSRALLLAESGRSDVTAYGPALATKLELPYVVTDGEAQIHITVVRPQD